MLNRRLHSTLIAATALLVLALLPGRALAEKAPRVGIVLAVQVNLKKSEAQSLSYALGKALQQKLVVEVVAGAEAIRRLPAEGVSESCMVDEVCIRDTAQRLQADELLFLAAVRVGNRIQVDSTWVDPSNGRNASRPKVVMVKLEEAEGRFADAASLILPDAAVRPTTQPMADIGGGSGGAFLVRTTPRHMTVPTWIAGGVSVAAGGVWLGFFLATRSEYNELKDQCQPRGDCKTNSDYEPIKDSIDKKAITADIFGTVALASLATGAILYWTSGGDIERVPIADSLRVRHSDGATFVVWEGDL